MTQDTIPNQLDDIRNRLDSGDRRMTRIEEQIAENTDLTKDIRDALVFGRVGTRIIKWSGAIAGACLSMYGVFYALTHGGKPPH